MALACGKGNPPTPPAGSQTTRALPKELESAEKALSSMSEQTRLEMEHDAATRRELVSPAPPGFVPKAQGRKLELALIPQKTMIRQGEPFWYRAEVKNVGTEPIEIRDSFINSGSGGDGWSKFRLDISPAASTSNITFGSPGEPCMFDHPPVPGWGRMTSAQKAAATERWMAESKIKGRVNIKLHPGETLRTRDWRPVPREEQCVAEKTGLGNPERPGGLFRQHPGTRDFRTRGTYRVNLVLEDSGTNAELVRKLLAGKGRTPADIESYLTNPYSKQPISTTSNEVVVEVVP